MHGHGSPWLFLVYMVIGHLAHYAQAISVYDCNDPSATIRSIDLTGPAPCPDPDADYNDPVNTSAQIIRTPTRHSTLAYLCTVKRSSIVTPATATDPADPSPASPFWETAVPITGDNCRRTITNAFIELPIGPQSLFIPAPLGQTSSFKFYTNGNCLRDMCHTTNFTSNGFTYNDSYEHTTLRVHVRAVTGTIDRADGTITFNTGQSTYIENGALIDPIAGTFIWDYRTPTGCPQPTTELFAGNVTVYRHKQLGLLDAVVRTQLPNSSYYISLFIIAELTTCRARCFTTQIPDILVCIPSGHHHAAKRISPGAMSEQRHDDLSSRAHSALWSAAVHHSSIDAKVSLQEACHVARFSHFSNLAALTGPPEIRRGALLALFGPGYKSYWAGAVAYVIQCMPTEANVAAFPDCTHEIPVNFQNRTWFVDPLSWTLSDTPTIIPCSPIMPASWRIGERWFCRSGPHRFACTAPAQLRSTAASIHFSAETRFRMSNIFSPTQITAHQQFLRVMDSGRTYTSPAPTSSKLPAIVPVPHVGPDGIIYGSYRPSSTNSPSTRRPRYDTINYGRERRDTIDEV
jgi:hypothetical protein